MAKKFSIKDVGNSSDDTISNSEALKKSELVIDYDLLRKQNVFFATPCYGGQLTDQYYLSIFKSSNNLAKLGVSFRLTTLRNESLITRARNILTAMFLGTDATHLFFIDADIEFDEESVVRILAMDEDVVVGAYPKKTLPIQYALNFYYKDPVKRILDINDKGAVRVKDASTGFFCIKRHVIEKMMNAHPELHYKNDSNIDPSLQKYCYALFDTIIDEDDEGDNRYLSEDYTFCRRWQKLNGKIWLDPQIKLNHIGSHTYEGDLSKIINI